MRVPRELPLVWWKHHITTDLAVSARSRPASDPGSLDAVNGRDADGPGNEGVAWWGAVPAEHLRRSTDV